MNRKPQDSSKPAAETDRNGHAFEPPAIMTGYPLDKREKQAIKRYFDERSKKATSQAS